MSSFKTVVTKRLKKSVLKFSSVSTYAYLNMEHIKPLSSPSIPRNGLTFRYLELRKMLKIIFAVIRDGCPIPPGGTLHRTFTMTPRIGTAIADRHGVALDGRLRNEDTELASTTLYSNFHFILVPF